VDRLKSRQPQIKVLYMSGSGPDALRRDEIVRLSGHFVQKPFRKEVLLKQLERTLEGGEITYLNTPL
jgi:FixJ family two-component response regulator